ncbi:roadblock/LC7 domain-containing protein [Kitasatospora hibisci]|uniref:roadblock/LC7 domain-containing protein n=1 Tax=Kitasatospora hibisci TaxID=3369522 RepID=UPI003754BA3A
MNRYRSTMPIKGDDLATEMRLLRDRVIGVTDVVVASADGLLITAETDDAADPEVLAALTAAAVGIARRSGSATGKGPLRHTTVRFSDGYLFAQAIGELGLIAVLGDAGMDMKRLHVETQGAAERIGSVLAPTKPTPPPRAAGAAEPGEPVRPTG